MIVFIALLIGVLLPTLIGWMLLKILEGKNPVLLRLERWCIGFVLGGTLFTFASFLLEILGVISFTRFGFILTFLILFAVLGAICYKKGLFKTDCEVSAAPSAPLNKTALVMLLIIGIWTVLKIASGAYLLVYSPPYHNDVINNWNYRGKVFFYTQELTLDLERGYGRIDSVGISSYPPSVPLMKTWLATLHGSWHEGLANSIHILWYICALCLVYCALRRYRSRGWSLLGLYLISSIPLYLMHGSVAYADIVVSLHVFITVICLFNAVMCTDSEKRNSFLRISAVAMALLIFTKNEGLALYLPIFALIVLLLCTWHIYGKTVKPSRVLRLLMMYTGIGAVVLIPWLIFKWVHNLPFGNAKAVSGLELAWQEGVLQALGLNLFFNGSWIFLIPLLIVLLIAAWKSAWKSPLVIISGFILLVMGAQIGLFLFTNLSVEVILGTGYSRGIIQLVPLIVFLCMMLGSKLFKKQSS